MNKTIINGIDVSECNFRLEREGKQKCECTHATGFRVICDCENWDNCYYKQLKRLQEENEELKANKGRCAFKRLDNTFCDEAKIQIDKLKLDKDCLNASLETARKYRGISEADRDKYKQALEEIREEANRLLYEENPVYGYNNSNYFELLTKYVLAKTKEALNDRD